MYILIAPNSFKHALSATDAAAAIREGLEESRLAWSTRCFPVGDGGDGTGELLIQLLGGTVVTTQVCDPLGRKIEASMGLIHNGSTAVIEMANTSGLRLLHKDTLNPLRATSYGTGLQIVQALDRGVRNIIIGMGGSATVDGGAGMLQALGVRFLDEKGNLLQELPESLTKLHTVDDTQLDPRIKDSTITVLCDVSNPLLGKEGAAAVFGPQKGASEAAVHTLEAGLSVLAKIALSDKGKDIGNRPHTGTAGGAAAGLYAFAGARLVNGIDQFLEMTGFEQALEKAALVITGEGSIDEQTLGGKAPLGVAKKAKAMGIPVIGMAGKVPMTTIKALDACFDILLPISNGPLTLEEAILYTRENLKRTACLAGNMLALQNGILPTVSASEQVISNQQNSLHTS